ncbi:MAG TPA: hypothetical protein VK196_05495 [Magnetospirillum sp.]|nr:hypothetical protein [Magnetospirillum sp.]
MNARDLERVIANFTRFDASDLALRTRALREAGFIPGRQGKAIDLGADHVAAVLIGVAAAPRPANVAAQCLLFSVLVGGTGRTFAEDLAQVIAAPERAGRVAWVRVCHTAPQAEIAFSHPSQIGLEVVTYLPPQRDDRVAVGCIRSDATIDGAFLHQLSIQLKTGGAFIAVEEAV